MTKQIEVFAPQIPVVFVHIPKCSGTAFENYFLSQDGMGAVSRAFTGLGRDGNPETVTQYFEREAPSSPFLFGHFSYRDILGCCPPAFHATFVRDPVRRTVSHYKSWHDKNNFHPADPHYIAASPALHAALSFSQRATLEEFVSSDDLIIKNGALGNRQTLYLSTYAGEEMEGHLESAKKNLAATDFFGITEYFEDSIELFRKIFPKFGVYSVEAEAENRSRVVVEGLPGKVKEIIDEQVKYDRQLYEYACKLFKNREGNKGLFLRGGQAGVAFSIEGGETPPRHVQGAHEAGSDGKLHQLDASSRSARTQSNEAEHQAPHDVPTPPLCLSPAPRQESASSLQADERAIDLGAQLEESEAARRRLAAHIVQLEASYTELLGVYREIVGSRSWRFISTLQSVVGRLFGK